MVSPYIFKSFQALNFWQGVKVVSQDSVSYWAFVQLCVVAVNTSPSPYFDVTILIHFFSHVFFRMCLKGLIIGDTFGTVKWTLLSVRVLSCSEKRESSLQNVNCCYLLEFYTCCLQFVFIQLKMILAFGPAQFSFFQWREAGTDGRFNIAVPIVDFQVIFGVQ